MGFIFVVNFFDGVNISGVDICYCCVLNNYRSLNKYFLFNNILGWWFEFFILLVVNGWFYMRVILGE